eukprot:CAMPEP_0115635464 /NCGR_PEP_ID=MMETSP0272-20121206/33137_1 /TAXON_ID=71861 /ORGANISM="Scrippsiella trochoidea, Strain CCMP3099" /LENGTH=300 /DNA_ID=CAMNT_0003072379 /DNA_START=44 /DNA_END=948 /DNA_ORIENTATION=-
MAKILALSMLGLATTSAAAAAATTAQGTPLITTDVIYGTYELVYDVYAFAWAKADVDGLMAKLPMDDVKKVVSEQMAKIPPEVTQALSEAQTKSVQLKALAAEYAEKAYDPANELAVNAITKLEAQLPALTGMIPKTLGNLALFVVYMSLVLYTVLKIVLFVVRTIFGVLKCILCCFCCCSLCRRRGSSAAAEKNGKAKAASKGKQATNGTTNGTTNGKAAAAATNGKATAAKAKAKKESGLVRWPGDEGASQGSRVAGHLLRCPAKQATNGTTNGTTNGKAAAAATNGKATAAKAKAKK